MIAFYNLSLCPKFKVRLCFQGSELAYIYTCVFLGFIPILCAGAGYGVVKLQNSKRRKLKIKQEELKNAHVKGEKGDYGFLTTLLS